MKRFAGRESDREFYWDGFDSFPAIENFLGKLLDQDVPRALTRWGHENIKTHQDFDQVAEMIIDSAFEVEDASTLLIRQDLLWEIPLELLAKCALDGSSTLEEGVWWLMNRWLYFNLVEYLEGMFTQGISGGEAFFEIQKKYRT